MKNKTIYFVIIFSLLTVFSCSDSDDANDANDEFLGYRDFIFNTTIDPTTLTQEDSFTIYSPVIEIIAAPESYTIVNNEELDVFNGTHTSDSNEYISLFDLDTYTYFFIRAPVCPDYFEYSHHNYSNNQLTITLDHFHEAGIVCSAEYVELYLVFRAKKTPNPAFLMPS